MPAATRRGDIGSQHGKHPPSPATTASEDVFVNGLGALRREDSLAPHPHPRVLAEGSPTVFINGRPAVRLGDQVDCGGEMISGSSNVFLDEHEPPPIFSHKATICQRNCMRSARRRGQAFIVSGDAR